MATVRYEATSQLQNTAGLYLRPEEIQSYGFCKKENNPTRLDTNTISRRVEKMPGRIRKPCAQTATHLSVVKPTYARACFVAVPTSPRSLHLTLGCSAAAGVPFVACCLVFGGRRLMCGSVLFRGFFLGGLMCV